MFVYNSPKDCIGGCMGEDRERYEKKNSFMEFLKKELHIKYLDDLPKKESFLSFSGMAFLPQIRFMVKNLSLTQKLLLKDSVKILKK